MPEIKNAFLSGKMNTDLDERLLPEGEYRDASNIQIASTEGSDVGTVQNIVGNKIVADTIAGGKCAGIIENTETDKIYVFIKGTSVDGIIEYDPTSNTHRPLILDARPILTKVLNFPVNDDDSIKKITGITILDNFLIFTDNESEPKILDISDTSLLFNSLNSTSLYNYTSKINGINFTEEDITLITKKPDKALDVKIKVSAITKTNEPIFENKFVRFAYRFKFNNGQRSPISPFTQPVFLPSETNSYDIDEGFNNQMENNIEAAKLSGFEVTHNSLEGIEIIYKESKNTNIYLYDLITKAEAITANTSGYSVNKTVKKSVIPEDQLLRAFDSVPHKAKAVDVVGNRIVFGNYKDGLNILDYNPSFESISLGNRTTIGTEVTRAGTLTGSLSTIKDTRTIKTGREYEIGVVFEDKYGRQTPVITADGGDNSGTKKVDFDIASSNFGTKFIVKMAGDFPSDPRLTKFKYYIKPSSNKFNNLIAERVANDKEDSGTCWLVVPSYEVNKVKEGQYMMLKKALNSQTKLVYNNPSTNPPITPDDFKFKILDISDEKPNNIEASQDFDGKFFVKVKKTPKLIESMFSNQGSAGINRLINVDEFDNLDSDNSPPANSLFIGQVGNNFREEEVHFKYYFKDGKIIELEVDTPLGSNGLPITITDTFVTGNGNLAFNQNKDSGANDFCKLSDANNNTGFKGGANAVYQDGENEITEIFIRVDSNNVPRDVFVEYTNQNAVDINTLGESPAVFETIPEDEVLDVYYETSECFNKDQWNSESGLELSWHNAYIMGNGIESSIINDDFNKDFIEPGIKVSTTISGDYKERNQKSSLIYSGIYNSLGGINKLNEFNIGLKITKELNPEYGSIQKLYTRDTDLLAFCEDKVLKVLANKDALFNADGNVNLTSTTNVLGQARAFAGDYGISKNPESFASHGYRIYFTDKARGVVLRISGDGSTVISDTGMSSYFRDKLLNETGQIIGSYDIHSDQYILTLPVTNTSISFSEDTKGWVSRLDFIPEAGVSINGNYYTCYLGKLYLHHAAGEQRNVFYGQNVPAGIKFIFNQEPSAIKNFKNISYEGTTGWGNVNAGVITDQQEGQILEFKEKEGKYFGLISGVDNKLEDLTEEERNSRLKNFSIQGLGNIANIQGSTEFTCTTANFTVANSNTTEVNGTAITSISQSSISNGTIVSVSPSTIQPGVTTYTANITVPNGFSNSGAVIPCTNNATGTVINQVFDCDTANFQVANGTVGDTVTGTVSAGTIASGTISPSTYQSGPTDYTATINIPGSGYTNSGTVSCTDRFTATGTSCAFSLGVTTYSSGGTTLSGTFTGSDIGTNPNINLTVASGTISPTTTTKSALASGLVVTASEGVLVTATISSGLCSGETATINMPQASTVVITGSGAAMVGANVSLSTNTTGVVTSYQWHKSGTSGFTPSNSTAISGANSSSLTVSESSASTQYYKVVINGPATSPQHAIVWTAWTSHPNLKYSSGTSVNLAACTASTTENLFGNGNFTAATQFAVNNQGSTTNFQQGTYSDGTNYRFINSSGVPSSHVACNTGGGNQGIKVSKCRDASDVKDILVTLPTGTSALAVGNIISFTETYDSSTHWVVTQIGLTLDATEYDALRTLSATHTSCLAVDPPTVSLSATGSVFVGEQISLTASPSFTPQGATFTYIFRKSTDGSTPTTQIAETTNSTITDTAQTSILGSSTTNKYTVEIKNTSPLIKSSPVTDVSVTIYNTLFFGAVIGGSSANATACTNTQNDYTRFANTTTVGNINKLYKNEQGLSFTSSEAGTYSKNGLYAFFNASGDRVGAWNNCPAASPSVTIKFGGNAANKANRNPYESLGLTTEVSNFASGTTLSYSWTQIAGPGSGATVLTTADNFTAALTQTVADGLASGSTITKKFKCIVTGSIGSESDFDEFEIEWKGKSQQLEIRHCTTNDTEYVKVINSDGYNNNEVVNIVDATGAITNGCYKILTAGHTTHESYDDVKISGDYPFNATSTCCNCSSCSASITTSSSGTAGVSQSMAAGNSGFSVNTSGNKYNWFYTTVENDRLNPNASSWAEITSLEDQQSFNISNSQAQTLYYMVKVQGFNATTTNVVEHGFATIVWGPASTTPVPRSYTLQTYEEFSCPDVADVGTVYGNYTSIAALPSGTTVTLSNNTSTCYKVVGFVSNYINTYPSIDNDYPNGCQSCYDDINKDCSFTLTAGVTYLSNNSAKFFGTFGTSISNSDTVALSVSSGTVSTSSTSTVTNTTVGALKASNGLSIFLDEGVTLTATVNTGTCNPTTRTATAPSLTCYPLLVYYTTQNPATSSSGKLALCGSSSTRQIRSNSSSLNSATQIYSGNTCATLESGTKYYSQDNVNYFIWNGNSLSSGIALNCASGGSGGSGGNIQ